MPDNFTEIQRVMPDHPGVSAAMWHVPSALKEMFAPEAWFTQEDLAECTGFTSRHRHEEWLAVRIALKELLIRDGVAESPLHIHIRKNEKGCPHIIIYEPESGRYARLSCSLSHKGSLVFAAYARSPGVAIGIDMERRSWRLPYLRKRFVADADRMLTKDDLVGDSTVLWSFKEATTKLLGLGMAYGFKNVQCRETSIGVCELCDAEGKLYVGRYAWFGKYALAVVSEPFVAPVAKSSPRHGRSWYARIGRARRLRALRRKRRVTAHLASIRKEKA